MAHANGRIYIDPNTTGVEIADLQRVLGRATGDLGQLCSDQEAYIDHYENVGEPGYDPDDESTWGDPVYAIRPANKINGWAKYKPFRSSAKKVMAEVDYQDSYFGLNVTPVKGTTVASLITNFSSQWTYLPPRGAGAGELGADEWPRLRDFDGYNHNANCFLHLDGCTLPSWTVVGDSSTFCIAFNTGNNLQQDSISLADLKLGGSEGTAFKDLYCGLIFKSGSTYKLVTSPNTVEDDSYVCYITLPAPASTANYMVYPVLSRVAYSSLTTPSQTDDIIALPLSPFSFEVRSQQMVESLGVIDLSAQLLANGRYNVTFKVALGGTMYQSISQASWEIHEATDYEDETGNSVSSGYVNNLTQGTPQSVSRTILSTPPQWVYVKVSDPARPDVIGKSWAQVMRVLPD